MNTPILLAVSACTLPFVLPAQEAPEKAPDPTAILKDGIVRMTKVNSVAFRTTEAQDSAMSRRIARQVGHALGGGGEVDVRGSFSDGILQASMNDDADQIIAYRGRMIARNDEVGWKLRRNRLASGAAMPFVLDPGRFFEAMQSLPASALQVAHHEESTYKDRKVHVVGLTLKDEAAQDFALSGALPPVSSGMGGGMAVILRGAGVGAGAAPPELTVDLALYIEAGTGFVLKIKSRCYQASPGGNFQVQIQGGGFGGGGNQEEQEEQKVEERDAQGNRIYKGGLPVRALKDDLSRMDFDVVLTGHGEARQPKLDDAAKRLLKLPQ